jgi:hypothetical protein
MLELGRHDTTRLPAKYGMRRKRRSTVRRPGVSFRFYASSEKPVAARITIAPPFRRISYASTVAVRFYIGWTQSGRLSDANFRKKDRPRVGSQPPRSSLGRAAPEEKGRKGLSSMERHDAAWLITTLITLACIVGASVHASSQENSGRSDAPAAANIGLDPTRTAGPRA